MSVTIKFANGTQTVVPMPNFDGLTVQELRVHLAPLVSVEADSQRLVYKGRILKDSDTMKQLGIADGHTIHLVKKGGGAVAEPPASTAPPAAAAPAPSAPATASPAPVAPTAAVAPAPATANPYGALFGAPPQQATRAPAPTVAGTAPGAARPQPSPGAAGHASLEEALFESQIQTLCQNPQLLEQLLQGSPMYQMLGPEERALAIQQMQNPDVLRMMMGQARAMAAGGGAGMGSAGGMAGHPGMMGPGGALPGAGAPAAATQSFTAELEQLRNMGFTNETANLSALRMSGGNVDMAVARLLGD